MPWQGVTVEEQRMSFIREWELGYYSVAELTTDECRGNAYHNQTNDRSLLQLNEQLSPPHD